MLKKTVVFTLLLICIIPSIAASTSTPFDTGQETESDIAYIINPNAYVDNRNGTVTDKITGLMWQKEDGLQRYNWYQASGTYNATHNQTMQNVCGMLSLGGRGDWRLPTKKELMSLVDYSVPYPGPTIKETYFPNTAPLRYWSSNSFAANPEFAWHVSFNDGSVSYFNKCDLLHVRCVCSAEKGD